MSIEVEAKALLPIEEEKLMNTILGKITRGYSRLCASIYVLAKQNTSLMMFLSGLAILSCGLFQISEAQGQQEAFRSFAKPNFVDTSIRVSVGQLFALIEGALGALIMVVAGLGAIVSSAMGAYRAAVGMLVVAVGAFILRALVSLFFGDQFFTVNVNQGNGQLTPQ